MPDQVDAVPAGIERWDQKFGERPDEWFFGREPSEMARLTLQFWRQNRGDSTGRALDLGCGEGRDSVYFARHGFHVTALDGSPTALGKLRKLAEEHSAPVAEVIQADVRAFPSDHPFDVVFAQNSLQFIGEDCLPTLLRLQNATADGGLNAVSVFTREAESVAGRPDLYRFDHNELKFHYRGWRLLFYGEEILWREPSSMYLSFARIIAQKTSQTPI